MPTTSTPTTPMIMKPFVRRVVVELQLSPTRSGCPPRRRRRCRGREEDDDDGSFIIDVFLALDSLLVHLCRAFQGGYITEIVEPMACTRILVGSDKNKKKQHHQAKARGRLDAAQSTVGGIGMVEKSGHHNRSVRVFGPIEFKLNMFFKQHPNLKLTHA